MNPPLTDAGLKQIKWLSELVSLGLEGTAVTEKGLRELQRVLPKCKITWKPVVQKP